MMLLNTLYNKFLKKNNNEKKPNDKDTKSTEQLRASISIGISKDQQYFFDIRWDYEDFDKSANDLANLIIGLQYGLFVNQVKDLLINYDTSEKPQDELLLYRTAQIIEERSKILENIINDPDAPIIKPSSVFNEQRRD